MLRYLLWCVSLLVFACDQLTKGFLSRRLYPGESIPIIKNILHISLVHNTGIAFGLFKNQTFFFIVLSLVVIAYILRDFRLRMQHYNPARHIALGLILGGACGNLLDRIRFGYVIDFLDFRIWPVFNIADSAITVGAIILGIELLFSKKAQTR